MKIIIVLPFLQQFEFKLQGIPGRDGLNGRPGLDGIPGKRHRTQKYIISDRNSFE